MWLWLRLQGLLIKFESALGFSIGVRAQIEITQMDHVCYRPHTMQCIVPQANTATVQEVRNGSPLPRVFLFYFMDGYKHNPILRNFWKQKSLQNGAL